MKLVLASTSPFRAAILHDLHLPFSTARPEVDETPFPNEHPRDLVLRLSIAKARAAVADEETFVIGSDQVATIDGDILGKPHTVENAVTQLLRFSGRQVRFYTGLCLRRGEEIRSCIEPFDVHFRALSETEIRAYVALEAPLNCAGSFKSEGLGILLFAALQGRDPNALIGLPLIALRELFEQYGVCLLTEIKRTTQTG
ncbi:MAG: nucleoside triphosphate pyrophosphatase [Cardiobacteriaceae bacterium]|nr:nucleoside triphosphate pyrophosphatase [Cardiobacteriaceae bacterium]